MEVSESRLGPSSLSPVDLSLRREGRDACPTPFSPCGGFLALSVAFCSVLLLDTWRRGDSTAKEAPVGGGALRALFSNRLCPKKIAPLQSRDKNSPSQSRMLLEVGGGCCMAEDRGCSALSGRPARWPL